MILSDNINAFKVLSKICISNLYVFVDFLSIFMWYAGILTL